MYDAFAEEFERHAETGAYNALYDRPAVLDLVGDVAGLDVLDAGCGPGLYAGELIRRGARSVPALDASPEMVRLAKRRVGGEADVRVHDLQHPMAWVAESSFDAAVMPLVLEHLDERVSTLREIRRVLRPTACLVLSALHPVDTWRCLGGIYFEVSFHEEIGHGSWPVGYWRLPLSFMVDDFAEAGFVIERLLEPRPLPEMARENPDTFQKLESRPEFVAFRLLKHPWADVGIIRVPRFLYHFSEDPSIERGKRA